MDLVPKYGGVAEEAGDISDPGVAEEAGDISDRRVGEEAGDISDRRVGEETLDISDRLSSLPNDIISRILSHVPTDDAVRTSVLSKKWRSVYTFVPSIDVDDLKYSDEYKPSQYSFHDIIHRLIAENTNETIPFFCISCYDYRYKHAEISSWVLAAISKKVQILHLSMSMRPFYRLPADLYACTSLVTLSLHGVWIRCLGNGDFPKLKDLLLYSCVVDNPDSICSIANAAPLLERLCFHGCFFTKLKIRLSLPSLKSLCLRYAWSSSCKNLRFNVVLDTPKLRRLTFHNFLPEIQWETIPASLAEVRHHISEPFHVTPYSFSDFGVRLMETLNGLPYLKDLTLSSASQKVLLCSTNGLPVLRSLKHLRLRKYDNETTWRLLKRFSELAPNLVVLDMEKVNGDSEIPRNEDCFPRRKDCCSVRMSSG